MSKIIVPPFGPSPNDILLIGEAPGQDEAFYRPNKFSPISPRSFVGKSGEEQTWHLQPFGISPNSFRLANVIPEYTPGNPDPTIEQINRWMPRLVQEIKECNPRLIIAIGRFAMKWLLGEDADLDSCHGLIHKPGEFDSTISNSTISNRCHPNCHIIVGHHPAFGLHQPRQKTKISYDYEQIAKYVKLVRSNQKIIVPVDPFEGKEDYHDITGKELKHLLIKTFLVDNPPTKIAIDTEGFPNSPWSIQVSWQFGQAYCLRYSQPDFNEGIVALQGLINTGITVLLHDASTPQGTGYDIIMCRAMGLNLSRANLRNTMYNIYLLRRFSKGLKPSMWRFGPRMKTDDYMDLVRGKALDRQIDYLTKCVNSNFHWPEARIIKEPDGSYKSKRPKRIQVRAEAFIRDALSGKLDSKTGKPIDLYSKWYEDILPHIRQEAEEKLGPFPQPTLNDIDRDKAVYYACRDADGTLRIDDPILDQLKEIDRIDNLYSSPFHSDSILELSKKGNLLLPFWEKLQSHGLPASYSELSNLSEFMELQAEYYRKKICKAHFPQTIDPMKSPNGIFNPNSPNDTLDLIKKLGIKLPNTKRYLTKAGNQKVDKKSIEHLRYNYPEMDWSFQYREHLHIKDSFCTPYLESFVKNSNGDYLPDIQFVTSILDPAVTETRRCSSSKPNLLNVPSRTEIGRLVRSCFQAPDNHVLISVDYSGMELRVMADESGCPVLCGVFNRGEDAHKDYAKFFFKLDEVTKDQRYFGKTMNFSVGFGMIALTIHQQLLNEGIKHFTLSQCEEAENGWWDRYYGVKEFKQELVKDSRRKGYVRTRGGMIRYLPNLRSKNHIDREEAERHCFSHRIQGTAQDIIQNAMIKLWEYQKEFDDYDLPIKFLLQYHDEILALSHKDYAEMTVHCIKNAFINHCGVKMRVPIVTDHEIATNWGEL